MVSSHDPRVPSRTGSSGNGGGSGRNSRTSNPARSNSGNSQGGRIKLSLKEEGLEEEEEVSPTGLTRLQAVYSDDDEERKNEDDEGENDDEAVALSDTEQQAEGDIDAANAGPSAAGEQGARSDAEKDASDA